jgi:hypothetical protein
VARGPGGRPRGGRGSGHLAARGSVDRARLLVDDGDFAARRMLWRDVPTRLDGTGATAASLAAELLASAERAVDPLRALHASEMQALAAQADAIGERGVPGRKDIEDRHSREERRWRADELKAGLGVLAGAYRDRLVTEVTAARLAGPGRDGRARPRTGRRRRLLSKASAVEMVRNPNESLMLEGVARPAVGRHRLSCRRLGGHRLDVRRRRDRPRESAERRRL